MMRGEKGQSVVEIALMLPLLVLLLMGVVDLGRAYYIVVSLKDAADEGAAYAAIEPSKDAEIVSRASDAAGALVTISPGNVVIDKPGAIASGAPITVTVNYHLAT